MALNAITMDNAENTAKNWRGILDSVFSGRDGIIKGCGITNTANSITITAGYYVACGTIIEVDGATTMPIIPTLQTGYVRIKSVIDLTQGEGEQVAMTYDFAATATFPALIQEDVSSSGKKYEIEMCVHQISGGNITTAIRKATNISGTASALF